MNNESIHEALKLPSRYRIATSINGSIRIGASYHEQRLVNLRIMITDTLGQDAVHAVKVVHDGKGWREISGGVFSVMALAVITGKQIDQQSKEAWGLK